MVQSTYTTGGFDRTLASIVARLTIGARRHAQDDDIKVWDMELQPGETAPLHEHEYSYVFTVMVVTCIMAAGPLRLVELSPRPSIHLS